jgi:hypothetical protein
LKYHFPYIVDAFTIFNKTKWSQSINAIGVEYSWGDIRRGMGEVVVLGLVADKADGIGD